MAQTAHTWGIEQTGNMLWIGPMRPDGLKVDQVIVGLSYDAELTHASKVRQLQRSALIAAAPELLEALQNMVNVSRSVSGFSPMMREHAERVIAKAEGRHDV